MYAMILTRPNISYAVCVVRRYMASRDKEHRRGVKWIMRYLKGTLSLDLLYERKIEYNISLKGFVDSSYVGDIDRKRSLIGYMLLLNRCLINWKVNLQ